LIFFASLDAHCSRSYNDEASAKRAAEMERKIAMRPLKLTGGL